MPKRSNPFGDCSPLQFKSHIAQKEVDLGVNMQQNMKSVYEKTKSLLFEGSRRSRNSSCSTILPPGSPEWDSRDSLPCKPLPGQMTLDSCGTLFSCHETPPAAAASIDSMDTSTPVNVCNNNNNNMPNYAATQMQLDSTGKLVRSSNTSQVSSCSTRNCHFCNDQRTFSLHPCNFCDKSTCSSCLRPCAFCGSIVCPVCSTVNYDQNMERLLCLQCAS